MEFSSFRCDMDGEDVGGVDGRGGGDGWGRLHVVGWVCVFFVGVW